MPRRVTFADGPEMAVCLETGESVAPRSTHEFSRDLFLERANDKAATEAAVKMLADKMALLRLEDSPDVEMYDVANACQEDADADADAYAADGSSVAGSEDPSFAKQDKTVRRRVQDAENRALRLSARAVTNGWLDFALYVAFFPQLVAGPILRAREFLPQLKANRGPTSEDVLAGVLGPDALALEPVRVIEVDIDIKPGSDPNSINCNDDKGTIAVAILTTDDFDATTVDHTTVTFEGAGETHVNKKTGVARRHEEDVDGDGDTDLVLHFRLGDTDLTCDSTEGTLTGETFDGQAIEGTDAVRMIDEGGGQA